jgi:hypothetical protein
MRLRTSKMRSVVSASIASACACFLGGASNADMITVPYSTYFYSSVDGTSATTTLQNGLPVYQPFDRDLGRLTAATFNFTVTHENDLQDNAPMDQFANGSISTTFGGTGDTQTYQVTGPFPVPGAMYQFSGSGAINLATANGPTNFTEGPVISTLHIDSGTYPLHVNTGTTVTANITYTYTTAPGQLTGPGLVDFGYNLVGSSVSKAVTVSNTGDLPTTATYGDLVHAGAFSGSPSMPTKIFGGDSLSRTYVHAPTARGTDVAYIPLYDADFNMSEITLLGTAVAPVGVVGLSTLDAGNVRVGTSFPVVQAVYNNGDGSLDTTAGNAAKLSAHSPTSAGSFTLQGTPDSLIPDVNAVGVGDNLHLYVYNFTPAGRGAQSQPISIRVDNGNPDGTNTAGDLPFTLTGKGVGPVFQIGGESTGQTIVFPNQLSPSTVSLDLQNATTDGALATLDRLTWSALITNDPAHAFSIVGTSSGAIDAGGDTPVQVEVNPSLLAGDVGLDPTLNFHTDQNANIGDVTDGTSFAFPLSAVPEPSLAFPIMLSGFAMLVRSRK